MRRWLLWLWVVVGVGCAHLRAGGEDTQAPLVTAKVQVQPDYGRLALGFMGPVTWGVPDGAAAPGDAPSERLVLTIPEGGLPRTGVEGFVREGSSLVQRSAEGLFREVRVVAASGEALRVEMQVASAATWRVTSFDLNRRLLIEVFLPEVGAPGDGREDALGSLVGAFTGADEATRPEGSLRVVIDAGHGGHDPGAIGPGGLREKDVALRVAVMVADRLANEPGVEVMLTRQSDIFLPLSARAELANSWGADLFVSIHCNANPGHDLWGVETYYLDSASDEAAARLARLENEVPGGLIADTSDDVLSGLLQELSVGANVEHAADLAARVQSSLIGGLKSSYAPETVRDLGVKTALFYVLVGTRMPSILVETSFISYPREEMRLGDPSYQALLAHSIAEGILAHAVAARRFSGAASPPLTP